MEFKGRKHVPEVLYAKQYLELDTARKAIVHTSQNVPIDAEKECHMAELSIQGAQRKCKKEIVENIIKPMLKNPSERNIAETFHEWELTWSVFFERINESHKLSPNASQADMRDAIELRDAEQTIDNMTYDWARDGKTEEKFELPKWHRQNMEISDKTDAEWAKEDKEAKAFAADSILTQKEIEALLSMD